MTNNERVRDIVSNSNGWNYNDVNFNAEYQRILSGDPKNAELLPPRLVEGLRRAYNRTSEIRKNDRNNPKASLQSIEIGSAGELIVRACSTDYFTLWGIPVAAPELHQEGISTAKKGAQIDVPVGISSHNIVLTSGDEVMLSVRSLTQGFAAGRYSLSFEEQMEPGLDIIPHNASSRGLFEEFGFAVKPDSIKLLAVGVELDSAYSCWLFCINSGLPAEEIKTRWQSAPDHNEASALLRVPINNIDHVKEEMNPDVWRNYLMAGQMADDAILKAHPTVSWRIRHLQNYFNS